MHSFAFAYAYYSFYKKRFLETSFILAIFLYNIQTIDLLASIVNFVQLTHDRFYEIQNIFYVKTSIQIYGLFNDFNLAHELAW